MAYYRDDIHNVYMRSEYQFDSYFSRNTYFNPTLDLTLPRNVPTYCFGSLLNTYAARILGEADLKAEIPPVGRLTVFAI